MLDDLLELAADLAGDTAVEFLSDGVKKRRQKAAARHARGEVGRWTQTDGGRTARPGTQKPGTGKLTARREKRYGEDPWEWKEEKPPWEG
ncbi:MAG TPA: hypothetical protein H9826_10850 [Candidatus Intestinimonas merdavium]|uniref:Uncharacterized protein n=1 Tax=Candidatus Intestinimonas merdavium TaxID=2838622 RepID=A0A9D2CFM9_9FIRM|nr:hypothetical protein [Candidatus Intestinimonas merdavium]